MPFYAESYAATAASAETAAAAATAVTATATAAAAAATATATAAAAHPVGLPAASRLVSCGQQADAAAGAEHPGERLAVQPHHDCSGGPAGGGCARAQVLQQLQG